MKRQGFFIGMLGFLVVFLFSFFVSHNAMADPILDVDVSSNVVLLGGQARYTITVHNTAPPAGNTDTDKGYNLSLESVFSSDRIDPEGFVTFASASDGTGALAPSATSTDANGDTTVMLTNIKDLAANETYTFTMTVDLSGDATWEAMDHLIHNITASVNTVPDGSGGDVTGNDSDTSDVMPIALMRKTTNQSSGVEQLMGTLNHPYSYSIEVQNNYVNNTDNVVVTDTLPDGVEFLGVTSGHSCVDSREDDTGITTIVCDLSTMTPSGNDNNHVIEYDTGIRYDYYGTDNGGTNRDHDDFDGDPVLGTPIADKTQFTNTVVLDAEYQSQTLDPQTTQSNVTAAYATVNKSGDRSSGGNTDVITYTINYLTSEYYEILDDDIDDDNSSITLHDFLPDGQTYNSDADTTPSSYIENSDGTSDIYWNSSVLGGLTNSDSLTVEFSATVDNSWSDGMGGDGALIVGADRMNNTVDSHGEWDDLMDTSRLNGLTDSSAGASFGMATPMIMKEVQHASADPGVDPWFESIDATVGDQLRFRVRFNTSDGASADVSNVNLGDIVVTDWLPPGVTYNSDAAVVATGSFTGGNYDTDPNLITIGGLSGLEWDLGDVGQGGWWEAEFTVDVVDGSDADDGKKVNNIWKMTGLNTAEQAYSDRDNVEISYYEPHLTLNKTASSVPDPLLPGSSVEYTLQIENTGNAPARDVLITDTLDAQMRDTTPLITSIDLNGTNLFNNTHYKFNPAYDSGTGVWSIDLSDTGAPAVETEIPAGEILTVVYTAAVNGDVGMGAGMTNVATVGYNTQHDGSGRATNGTSNTSDDNTDDATIDMPDPGIVKTVSSGPYRVGDSITYTVEVTVDEGQILYWPDVFDRVDRDGVTFDSATAISHDSGSPTTYAAFSAGNSTPVIDESGGNQTRFTWYLDNSIDNRPSGNGDYVFSFDYTLTYDGLEDGGSSWEFFQPGANNRVNNTAYIRWADYNAGSRMVNHTNVSDNGQIDIDQPLLSVDKTNLSGSSVTSGSAINYEIIIKNDGYAEAFDITLEDDLSPFVGGFTLTSIKHHTSDIDPGTDLTAGVDYTPALLLGDPININFSGGSMHTDLLPGESISLRYSVTVQADVGAGATVTNTADADWSSQDGTVTGERVYNDSAQESSYTDDTSTANASVSEAGIVKSIIDPVNGSVTVGETVTYNLEVTVPAETRMQNVVLTDVVTSDGMEFVADSVRLGTTSGNPESGMFININPRSIDTSTPNPGMTIEFDIPTVIDNSSLSDNRGDVPYVFNVEYELLATGNNDDATGWVWDPSIANIVENTGTIAWNDGSADHSVTSNPPTELTIEQPYLVVDKSFDATSTVNGGDTIHATVEIENDGDSTAYENDHGVDFVDTMPVGFTNPHNFTIKRDNTTATPISSSEYVVVVTGNDFTIEFNSANTNLAPGELLFVEYDVDIDPLIGSGGTISNSVDLDYSSMDGDQSSERDYDDSDPLEGTDDEDSASVTTESSGLTKVTTLGGAGGATIGQEFDYVITASIPSNTTTYDSVVTDTVPDGLTVIGTSTSPVIGSVTVDPEVNGETLVTWDAGDVANGSVASLELTISVRVDDVYDNSVPLDGLPAGVDSDAQDVITNDAAFDWNHEPANPTTHHTINTDVDVTITEPNPTISKTADRALATINETIRYTATIGNDGESRLYGIVFEDTLDPLTFVSGSNPTIHSVAHVGPGDAWTMPLSEGAGGYTLVNTSNPIVMSFDESAINLAPNETIEIVYDATVANTATASDEIVNSARVQTSSSLQSSVNDREYSTTPVTTTVEVAGPDLTITNSDGGITVDPGNTITYTHNFENVGDAAAPNAVITQTVPDHTTFNGTPGWTCADVTPGSVCTVILGTLPPGASGSVPFTVVVDDPLAPGVTSIPNSVSIADDGTNGADPTPANNVAPETTPLSGFVDLYILKDDGGQGVIQGDDITYTLTYGNNGDQNATGVVITETVPDHTTFNSGASDSGWSCAGTAAGSACTYAAGTVNGHVTGNAVNFAVTAIDPLPSGINEITNTATITDDGASGPDANTGDNEATDNTPVVFDPPSALKTLNAEGLPEIEWKMVWINNGNTNALNVQVIDSIPTGTSYVPNSVLCDARGTSATDVCTYDSAEDRVRWEGNIGPDAGNTTEENSDNEVVITFRTSVPDEMEQVENQAEAYWDEDGDGSFLDEQSGGQTPVSSDDPGTNESRDPTAWVREDFSGDSSIGNYIWHDVNGDGKQDDNEKGIEDIRVKLTWAGIDDRFGTSDDQVWRTDTNHNGHYLFEDLPEGKFKVKVKKEDVVGWIQTYDPGSTFNGKAIVHLGPNDHHTKADFGYNTAEQSLARTGDNSVLYIVSAFIALITGSVFIWQRKKI